MIQFKVTDNKNNFEEYIMFGAKPLLEPMLILLAIGPLGKK